jgi:hypothetical protein
MINIIILLGEVWYSPVRTNKMFQTLKLSGHYTSALEFKKKYPQATIVQKDYLNNFKNFINNIKNNDPVIIIYCGHGSIGNWCIGISRNDLINITSKIKNNITIVSDSCFSDSMDISNQRNDTLFISAARSSGKDENVSAFFTFDGGYLSNMFYKEYEPNIKKEKLEKRILKNYYKESSTDKHLPRFFSLIY